MAAEQLSGELPDSYHSIALVDISYLFKKNYMAMARDSAPGQAAQRTLEELALVRESVEHVIVCCDAPPYRRKDVYPEYKATREKAPDEEIAQKRWLLERIQKDGYPVAREKGYEADDIIATLAASYSVWCTDVRIIGSDKDVAACVNEHVRMFVPASGSRPAEIRGPEEVRKKYGVKPSDMPLYLALCGDKGDNVPGVPGIGPKKAAQLIAEHKDIRGLGAALVGLEDDDKPSAMWRAIADNWDALQLSLRLVTLDAAVPVDCDGLLVKPQQSWTDEEDSMSETNGQSAQGVTDADFVPISPPAAAPAAEAAPKAEPKAEPAKAEAEPPKNEPPKETGTALARWGAVDEDLQPRDLQSAQLISKWLFEGRLYGQFPTATAVFSIILRGKELGLKATTALAGFHLVEGKPYASADLIHSLAERDPQCEYFRLIESSASSATWETKHRLHPEPTRYTYTIEEAAEAGLLEPSRSGKPSNWIKRPRDMLSKTAKSKLARLVYPGSCIGLYAPEEMEAA